MKPGVFRFEALLDVYQTQEDSLKGEISSLEGERKGVLSRIEDLLRECLAARKVLSHGGRVNEVESVVRYVEGLRHWIEQSRIREEACDTGGNDVHGTGITVEQQDPVRVGERNGDDV